MIKYEEGDAPETNISDEQGIVEFADSIGTPWVGILVKGGQQQVEYGEEAGNINWPFNPGGQVIDGEWSYVEEADSQALEFGPFDDGIDDDFGHIDPLDGLDQGE